MLSACFIIAFLLGGLHTTVAPQTAPQDAIANQASRPWMGVRLTPVPDALQAHLQQPGLMIANVVADSPAHIAGLERFDVLTHFGTSRISGFEDLRPAIARAGIGRAVKLRIIRGNRERTLTITLSERPLDREPVFVFEEPEPVVDEDQKIGYFGHKLEVTPDGGMILKPRGALGALPDEFKAMLELFPRHQVLLPPITPKADYFGDPPANPQPVETELFHFNVSVRRGGETLTIRRTAEGEIHVTRTRDEGAPGAERTFESVDELRDQDPEAYKLYRRIRTGLGGDVLFLAPELPDLNALQREFQREFERSFDRNGMNIQPGNSLNRRGAFNSNARLNLRSESVEIETGDDGSIKLEIRRGANREFHYFKNESDFKTRNPELYERYKGHLRGSLDFKMAAA